MIHIQFILFGVIAVVYGRQIREYDDPEPNKNDSELEKLLQDLFKQGKLDDKKHHLDSHSDHELHHDLHHGHETNPSLTNIQTLNLFYKKHPNQKSRDVLNTQRTVDTPSHALAQAQAQTDKCGDQADEGWGCEEDDNECKSKRCGKNRSSNDHEPVDEVANLLNELEQQMEHGTVQIYGADDLRCGCGKGRNDRDDDDKEKDDLRCGGNRCGRGRADSDVSDPKSDDSLRCRGNRCGKGRADDSNRDGADILRCKGNRCGRGRSERGDKPDDALDQDTNLRCRGNRCGRGRSDRADTPDDGLDYGRNDLRCQGNRCGRGRDGKDDDDKDGLRCKGNRCGRGRSGKELKCIGTECVIDNYENDDVEVINNVDKPIKKYKISDDLDAIVLNVGDLDHLLTKLGKPTPKNLQDVKILENIDLDSLLGNKRGSEGKRDVEAIVIDMSNLQNDDTVANQTKHLASLNNEKIHSDNRVNENRQIADLFSQNQQRLIEVNKLIGNLDTKNQKASKILPHREENNNVYVPKWLHDAVLSNSKIKQQVNENNQFREIEKDFRGNISPSPALKNMYPLTIQQKNKMVDALKRNKLTKLWRRNVEKDVGVPFELQVQGLGQVKS